MLTNKKEAVHYEKQSKFIQERITSVEKNFSELCTTFALYARKVARLRDAGDELSKVMKQYSDNETVNKSLSAKLAELSITLCAIEDYRNAQAQRLEVKVVGELSQYENICKHFRGEMKHTLSVRDGELSKRKSLERIRERNPSNRQGIINAETELRKASADTTRTVKELEERTDSFERKKLQNLKNILKTFVEIEMAFQVKAIELCTVAYNQIDGIDCESDLEVFQKKRGSFDTDYKSKMKPSEGEQRSGLGSIASLLSRHEESTVVQSEESEDDEDGDEGGSASGDSSRDSDEGDSSAGG